ncbi:hypothetical protein [Kibdelosporangium phytohabitans]|uniref:Uncharacterized protein n=1 Tax=Kibdelosporangium phytohabitans TaxID=860235 RepID=A0A0N9I6K3_9PSEU|nr:hypothetical protein [Kibdelosporangium phytohabitans]ALG10386.1 hypothetical protein AOZ06_28960 [Kibdelosporangium phytohabitans]MBE1461442.1 hypothetical protein [Kibdelosporangium phytohabitans]
MLGPDLRVIADAMWAKLVWAGLNIQPEDLSTSYNTLCYPLEFLRALRWPGCSAASAAPNSPGCELAASVGSTRDFPIPGDSREVLARDAICLFDVPTHRTGTAFTKPVDPLLGKTMEAWEAARPDQPAGTDRKTGEQVHLLFAMRARPMDKTYINRTIIPALCRKAGVPTADARGATTSHRARSTIASQLYNAKGPMTLMYNPGQRDSTQLTAETVSWLAAYTRS